MKNQIVMRKVGDLVMYDNNPRNNNEAVDKVAESIIKFGFLVPIVIDKENVIVAGETRLKASKKLNLSEVPCIVADDLTDEQIKAFRLIENKTSEFASWDFEKLEEELNEINLDMSQFGFEDFGNEFIDLLLNDDDLISKTTSPDEFSMTLLFPNQYKEDITAFSREELSEIIIREATGLA